MKRVTRVSPRSSIALETRDLLSFAFQVALISYLGFYLLETIIPGFVTLFFKLPTLLWITVVLGASLSVWPGVTPIAAVKKVPRRGPGLTLAFLSLLLSGVVWYKTRGIGSPSIVIAVFSALMVYGLGWLVHDDWGTAG
ncbi:MAG: hypothetical protein HY092_03895 [Candidatus Kerfeldbacteria bacterium]|nr:hypothetical protein [Candidatus Kerfeldbacteria bacterium]